MNCINAIPSQGQEKLEKSLCQVHTGEGETGGLIYCMEASGQSSGGTTAKSIDVKRERSLASHLRKLLSFTGTAGECHYCYLVWVKHLEGY